MTSEQNSQIASSYRPLADLIPAHWRSANVTTADGVTLHYWCTSDDRPPVLLLHGVQVDGLMWLRTAQALEADYTVIMPDFRGHGRSSRLAPGLNVPAGLATLLVEDTRALMQALKLDRPVVIGHSLGADIAGRLAAVESLRGVVLVDPALADFAASMPDFDIDAPPSWFQPIIETVRSLATLPHEAKMNAGLNLLPPGTALWDEADYVPFVEGQGYFDLRFFNYIKQMGRYLFQMPEVLARIDCPLLLLTARPMMPHVDTAPGLAAFAGHAHLHFEDSGHFIMFDQFEQFMVAVRGLLR